MGKKSDKDRPLTAQEKELWQQLAKTVTPIRRVEEDVTVPESPRKIQKKMPVVAAPPAPKKPQAKPLRAGVYDDIDGNTADRVRKGKYPIDATLDLHGMTREKAHAATARFIRSHYEKGSRCLLVITGKGLRKNPADEARGVLKEMLPGWLAADELRPFVLAFDVAKQQHGGSGAWYVLLKRKR